MGRGETQQSATGNTAVEAAGNALFYIESVSKSREYPRFGKRFKGPHCGMAPLGRERADLTSRQAAFLARGNKFNLLKIITSVANDRVQRLWDCDEVIPRKCVNLGVLIMRTMLVAVSALAVLAACGGGSTTGSTNPVQGVTQAVATSGTITAFGSVYVNGVRYDVSAASLKKNGKVVAQSSLAVGEVALVRGQQNLSSGQGSASSVEVEDNVVGPIAIINAADLTVLGQMINVTATTSFGRGLTALSSLKVGDLVEVSGLAGTGGAITATRIALAKANESLQVVGTVAAVTDPTAATHTFTINGLTVDFTTATVSGFTGTQPANGDLVVVRGGTLDAAGTTLTAKDVFLAGTDPRESSDGHAETGHVEQEGLVTAVGTGTPIADFTVGGAKVLIAAATVFKGGTVADLAVGARVEVRGTLDSSGNLVADAIVIGHVGTIDLVSTASALTATTVTLLGAVVTVDANTRFEDDSAANVQMFTLANVADGDTLRVRGYESPVGSGNVLATRLERLPPSTTVVVRGAFSGTTAPMFKVLNIMIDATNATFSVGEREHATTLTSADFFTQAVGQIVDVQGTANGTAVTATAVNIDHQEDR